MEEINNKVICIAGPTAIGKTKLAIHLANFCSTSILSADSRQFFKEMSIGTAKPTNDELAAAKHYGINIKSINDEFNAGDFEDYGLEIINQIHQKNPVAIMVGGSGLYINALLNGLDVFPEVASGIREQLNEQLETEGIQFLLDELKATDPDYFNEVDQANPQRIIRALEVCRSVGKPYSSFRTSSSQTRPFQTIKIGLTMDRVELYDRINRRVDQMVDEGLLNEVKALYPFRNLNALQTVGYTELFSFLAGDISFDKAIELIKQNTRRYAKRQLTWFKKDQEMTWFNPNDVNAIEDFVKISLKK